MADKEQIIIDGVDVSGCLFYQSNFEEDYDVRIKHFCSNWHNCCKSSNNQNCYFKQLKRKEQEGEVLKSESFTREELITLQEKDINRYRKALEEIEKIVSKNYYDDTWADISIKLDDILNIINNAKGEGKCQ